MEKIDYKRALKALYQPPVGEVVEVEAPAMNYLMVDDEGDPNTAQAYREAVEALYAVAYAVKFMVKTGPTQIDYGVMPLEGLWWADDMARFSVERKSEWRWTMMIMQPEVVTRAMVETAIADVRRSSKKNPAAVGRLRFEALSEGVCAQIMHIGPFSEEGPTVDKLHAYIDPRGGRRGKHHEIYLTDIRRADPAKWRTIIRQPMVTGDEADVAEG